jgi:hypothetical protein
MDQQYDPGNVFAGMHHKVTGELLRLMDGLYSNIEDGLFELASRTEEENHHRHCFDLMRELRFRRSQAIQQFARGMQGSLESWFNNVPEAEDTPPAHRALAQQMSEKCSAHFGGVLQSLAERTAYALNRDVETSLLPISPYKIACNFIRSMKALEFDDPAIDVVQELFGRFVLDRMGPVYGECNSKLEQAGFFTARELELVASARA